MYIYLIYIHIIIYIYICIFYIIYIQLHYRKTHSMSMSAMPVSFIYIYPVFTESSECHGCIRISSLAFTEMNNVLCQSFTPVLECSLENRNFICMCIKAHLNIFLGMLSGVNVWTIIRYYDYIYIYIYIYICMTEMLSRT